MNAFQQKFKTWLAFEKGSYSNTIKLVKKKIDLATSEGELNVYVSVPLDQADKMRDYLMHRFFWVDLPIRYTEENYAILYISWK